MVFAIAIDNKIKAIVTFLFFSFANNCAFGQVKELLFNDTEDIRVNQTDSSKTGIFVFIRDGVYISSQTNKLLQGLTCLEIYEDIDTSNVEVFLIKISGNSPVCSNKHLSLNAYELPSYFKYDPYRIVLAPSPKNYNSILKDRIDAISTKVEVVQNLKSTKSPFLSIKDHHDLLKLMRRPDHKQNYFELLKNYNELKATLDTLKKTINTIYEIESGIRQFIDNKSKQK